MGLQIRDDPREDLRGMDVTPMRLVASYLDVERRPLHPRPVVGDLEACLYPGNVVVCDDPPQCVRHQRRRGSDQGLRPSTVLVAVIVSDGVGRKRGLATLGGMFGHHDHIVHPDPEILRLAVDVVVAYVHVVDGDHVGVAAYAEAGAVLLSEILPAMHLHESRPHVDGRQVGFAAHQES